MAQVARARVPATNTSVLPRPAQRGYRSGAHDQEFSDRRRLAVLASLLGGVVALAHLNCEDPAKHLAINLEGLLPISTQSTAECAAGVGYVDKNLSEFKDKLDEGIEKLAAANPNVQRVPLVSGLRGTKYFVEFPIVVRNFDAYSLLQKVQQKLDKGKGKKYDVRVTQTDSYLKDEQVAYLVDYLVSSSQVEGTRCPGSLYIRGVKGEDGLDSFKFTLEKGQDFSDFDAQLFLTAYAGALTLTAD